MFKLYSIHSQTCCIIALILSPSEHFSDNVLLSTYKRLHKSLEPFHILISLMCDQLHWLCAGTL